MLSCFNLGLDHLIVEIITLSYLYVPLCMLLNKNTFDMLIGTWSDHPGQQCNHKAIWLWLGQLIRNLSVRYALLENG